MLRVWHFRSLFIVGLATLLVVPCYGKKSRYKEITGFIEKDVSGADHLYVDTGSKIYTLRYKSVFLDNQGVLKRKRIPNAQVTLKVKRKDILKVKKIKYKKGGYR